MSDYLSSGLSGPIYSGMKLFGAAASDNQNLGAWTANCQFFGARSRGIEIVAAAAPAEASAVKFLPPITRAPPLRGLLEFCTRAQQKHGAYKYARLTHTSGHSPSPHWA
jgi:hypothetical protein